MRFATFAASCVAVASYPDTALGAPLQTLSGAPDQYSADPLTMSQLLAEADAESIMGEWG